MWSGDVRVAWLVCFIAPGAAHAGQGLSLLAEAGPAHYRYTETGKKEFAGVETEWANVAFLGELEGRYTTSSHFAPLLRFSGLTSAEDTETNNQGSPETEMHIAYFFNVQPAVQYELLPAPSLRVAPEVSWDLDWYKQQRKTADGGVVDESVFWQGPAIGGELSYRFAERWTVDLGYRHSFLVDVSVSNTFTEGLGFSDFSTDGQRDVVELHLGRELAPRWMARLGYRFESARVDASRTQARMSSGPNPAFLQAQFPRNDHTVNALSVGVTFTF